MMPLDPRLLRRARPARVLLGLDAALGIASALLILAQALLIARIVARSFGDASLRAVGTSLVLLAAVVAARATLVWGFEVAGRALGMYLDELRLQAGTIFHLDDELRLQPNEGARIILYCVAQEALTNVRKHAQAGEVDVLIAYRDGGFLVRVTDDGVGFVPDDALSIPGHLGLVAMRERVELAGGTMRIDSAPNTGTVVVGPACLQIAALLQ
jgi:two-component sensor histidine kinase